jgi:hypothetical protein
MLAEDGISIICIFETEGKRKIVKDFNNKDWIIHPLQSSEHLKIEKSNKILIEENSKNKRCIKI